MGAGSSSLPTHWINLWVEEPHVQALWIPPPPAGSSSERDDWGHATAALQVGQKTSIELLPIIQVQGRHKQWCSPVPLVLSSSLGSESSHGSSTFSMRYLSCLLCRSYSIGSQLSLRRNCSKCTCTFDMFLGGGELPCHYLEPAIRALLKQVTEIQSKLP